MGRARKPDAIGRVGRRVVFRLPPDQHAAATRAARQHGYASLNALALELVASWARAFGPKAPRPLCTTCGSRYPTGNLEACDVCAGEAREEDYR